MKLLRCDIIYGICKLYVNLVEIVCFYIFFLKDIVVYCMCLVNCVICVV